MVSGFISYTAPPLLSSAIASITVNAGAVRLRQWFQADANELEKVYLANAIRRKDLILSLLT